MSARKLQRSQKYNFLVDCVLKVCAQCALMADATYVMGLTRWQGTLNQTSQTYTRTQLLKLVPQQRYELKGREAIRMKDCSVHAVTDTVLMVS